MQTAKSGEQKVAGCDANGLWGVSRVTDSTAALRSRGTKARLKNEAVFLKGGPEALPVPNTWPQLKVSGP